MGKESRQTFAVIATQAKITASQSDPWKIAYFEDVNHHGELHVPAREYLWRDCPTT